MSDVTYQNISKLSVTLPCVDFMYVTMGMCLVVAARRRALGTLDTLKVISFCVSVIREKVNKLVKRRYESNMV